MTRTKAIQAVIGDYNPAILSHQLEVNNESTSMEDFLFTNLCEEGVDHISTGDAKEVMALNEGETIYIGNSKVTRIK